MKYNNIEDLSGLGYAKSEILEKLVALEAAFSGAKATVAAYPAASTRLGAKSIIESTEVEIENLRRSIERSYGWANTYNSEDDQIFKIGKRLKKLQQDVAEAAGAEAPPDGADIPEIPGLPGSGKKDEFPTWLPLAVIGGAIAFWLYKRNQ